MNASSGIDIGHFRAKLETLQSELEDLLEISAESGATVELDQTSVGRLSRMDAMQRQAMALETERRRRQELQRIKAALRRIEEGEYGYCLKTGELIPNQRLELDPAAATIVVKREDS